MPSFLTCVMVAVAIAASCAVPYELHQSRLGRCVVETIEQEIRDAHLTLVALKTTDDFRAAFGDRTPPRFHAPLGAYDAASGTIFVRSGLRAPARAAVLIHEYLHHLQGAGFSADRGRQEVEAIVATRQVLDAIELDRPINDDDYLEENRNDATYRPYRVEVIEDSASIIIDALRTTCSLA